MLSEREKNGVRKLLEKLPAEELVHLANTVTNRLITIQNRQEAIKAIIMYTDDAEQFLRRRLVKRDLLFVYLADCDVALPPNADKSRIINTLLEYWQSSEITKHSAKITRHSSGVQSDSQELLHPSQEPSQLPANSEMASWSHDQELAKQFSSWFFSQLNALHPSRAFGSTSEWGPQHFLNDVHLKLCVIRGSDRHLKTYDGAEITAKRLECLVTDEQLMFNPNLSSDGTKGCSEAHGLVMIAVCGTLHQAGTCMGVFEQNFGLVRDPLAENNWKIKFVNLQIKSGSTQQRPTLEGSSNIQAITT